MVDYRDELHALVAAFGEHGGKWHQENEDALHAAIASARTLLDQPETEGMTDEELLKVFLDAKVADMKRQGGLTSSDANGIAKQLDAQTVAGLRAAIIADRARISTPQPPAAQEEAWRWWAYHPEESLDLCQTPEQARKQAIDWLNEDRSNACLDGWHEEQEKVSWGYLVPVENAQITERRAATEDDLLYTSLGIDEIDEIVSYEMLPANALPTPEAKP